MKRVIIFFNILLSLSVAHSQKVYFIYFQSENQQPFYVRMGDKIYNATSSGYLVLSKLRDSTYVMKIGIEGSQTKEQLFSLTVNKKDQGFLLKNFVEEGWGLFNLQNFMVIKSETNTASNFVQSEKKGTNSFNELLAKATDDSTLLEKSIGKKTEEIQKESSNKASENKLNENKDNSDSVYINVVELKKSDLPIENKINSKSENVTGEKIIKSGASEIIMLKEVTPVTGKYQRSTIKKYSESSTTEGFGLTFIDFFSNGTSDTINIFIPPNNKKSVLSSEIQKGDKKFLDIGTEDTLIFKKDTLQNEKITDKKSVKTNINKAYNILSIKYFSTLQIKYFTSVISSDEEKYNLFDTSYLQESNISNFGSL